MAVVDAYDLDLPMTMLVYAAQMLLFLNCLHRHSSVVE